MRKLLVCLLVAVGLTVPLTSASSAQTVSQAASQAAPVAATSPASQIRVVNANLLQGLWDWPKTEKDGTLGRNFDNRNLLRWLAQSGRTYLPDILTLQNLDWENLAHHHDCEETRDYLKDETGVGYGFYTINDRGGACILYRQARFDPGAVSGGIGNSWAAESSPASACQQGVGQSSIGIQLHDKLTGKTISVASVHMGGKNPCVEKNIRAIRNWAESGGDAQLILGDYNVAHGSGDYNTMVSLMTGPGHGFTEKRIWPDGKQDYFWYRGFAGGISNATLVPYSCCNSPTTRDYSDHNAGFADLSYTAPYGAPYPWTGLPGLCRDIGVSGVAAWCVALDPGAADSRAFRWTASGWVPSVGVVNRIAAAPDGTAWAVHSSGAIFHSNVDGSQWTRLPGLANDIGVGADGSVWIIGYAPGNDASVFKWNGADWWQTGGIASRIAVGPDGAPWVVHSSGQLYFSPNGGASWVGLPGLLRDIGIGANSAVWGVSTGVNPPGGGNTVHHWNGPAWNWDWIEGGLTGISVGADGAPWGVNSSGNVFIGVGGG